LRRVLIQGPNPLIKAALDTPSPILIAINIQCFSFPVRVPAIAVINRARDSGNKL
jgi:hypothetical protein